MSKKPNPRLRLMARRIQDAMKARGLDQGALADAIGLTKAQRPVISNWIRGMNGPGDLIRPKLATVLQVPEDQLVAPGREARSHNGGRKGPAQRAVALVQVAQSNGQLLPPSTPVTDVFVFRARSDGTIGIKLDAVLPYARGVQLINALLGFGLVIGAEDAKETRDGATV
jgi:transcriptional regulator with XRE-family HTH domain